jgi:hypothetical protein
MEINGPLIAIKAELCCTAARCADQVPASVSHARRFHAGGLPRTGVLQLPLALSVRW